MEERIKIINAEAGKYADIVGADIEGFCVIAQTERGEVFIHERTDLSKEDAAYLAKVVGMTKQITPDRWNFWRTVYGSAAFMEEESEAAQATHMIRIGCASEADFTGTAVGELI